MVGMLSDVGNYRTLNEDSIKVYSDDKIAIYLVADGMGGHNAGEIASRLAVEKIIEYIKQSMDYDNLGSILKEAICYANSEIFNAAKSEENLYGMGTTITSCIVSNENLIVANVGDSSCYVLQGTSLIKITKDHSLVQQLIDNGSITEEEALKHPNRNIITRALGTSENVEVDIFYLDMRKVDKVLLCSDGLTNEVTKKEMEEILFKYDNQASCDKLVKLSKEKGGRDNISVIVFGGECENDRNYSR